MLNVRGEITLSYPQEVLGAVKVHPCVSPSPVHCIQEQIQKVLSIIGNENQTL